MQILAVLVAALSFLVSSPARAGDVCLPGSADASTVEALRERIAGAATLAEARALALEPVAATRDALGRARWLAPGSDALARAEASIDRYAEHVAGAGSQAEVADAFASLVRPADGADVGTISGLSGCHYSTGETIAIVLGFILGIIPGIILLFLLC